MVPTRKQMQILARNPSAYVRWVTSGKLPEGVKPDSPLVRLLRSIPPHQLQRIRGLTVDRRLGYEGSRKFQFAAQALRWVAPDKEVFGSFPAESWRIKSFSRTLSLDDMAACCDSFPDDMRGETKGHMRGDMMGA